MSANIAQEHSDGHTVVRRGLAIFGVLITTGVAILTTGPLGVLIAVGVGSAQYLISAPAAFATGQLILSALFSSEDPLLLFVLAEIGLFGVLFSSAVDHHAPGRLAVSSLVAGIILGASGWLVLQSGAAIWIVASLLVGSTAFVVYGLHRYERVTLDLVEYNE